MREHETLAMMTNAIYKQDVDLGYTFSNYNPSFTMSSMSKPIDEAEKVEVIQNLNDTKIPDNNEHGIDIGYLLSLSSNVTGGSNENSNVTSHQKLLKIDEDRKLAEILYEQDIDLGYILSPTGSKESSSSKASDKPAEKISSDKEDSNDVSDLWAGIPFKIDNETGEYIRLPFEDIFKDFIPIDENDQKDDLPKVKEPQSPLDLDATIQDIANLLTPPNDFYPVPQAEATPYVHDNSYPQRHNTNMCYENQENQVYGYNNNHQRVDNFYQNNLLPSGVQNPNTLYAPNGGTHEDIHTDAYLDSILNSECFKMMDANNNQSSTAQQHGNPMDCSGSNGAKSSDKPPNASSSSGGGGGNAVNFLDLSCGSAGSSLGSLGSESLPSSSDGEWGEGSDPGNDYRRSNFYGPYDYSSNNSSNFTIRQMPVAQKKYHMFGKRYLQEEISNNTLTDSRARTLQTESPISDLDEKENSTYDDFEEEMKVHANLKNISKLIKTERDKFQRSDQNLVRHNHTYALSHSPDSNQSNDRDGSEYDDGPSEQGHLTRDEKRARNLNVPIPVYDIINLPMDEFNERVSKYELNENQLSLIRDIRRRGKNKVAAQNCRKRKLDTILSLESEVEEVRRRKEKLHNEKEYVAMEKKRIASKFATLHKHIFHYLKDDEGMPCSPSKFSLQQSADGSMYLLPRDNSKQDPNCYSMSLLMSEASTSSVCRERSRMKESSFGRTGADESHSITEL
ncbi:segmentation protein cap'n'collar-like isoform X2 [Episyrphus balteatus]|nr:segmentation protein cap'n'collar-like isoform X2 [Episyrphus balteatus]XP_055849264.1 segmentation protein cap'n'collar-like isoform X2 [Episyrphus balteatus]XP_055849265.1 segmentation protein cap'n'collar-like isoform X2 [Episyrphus balteatus]